jgi:hypothetical protein
MLIPSLRELIVLQEVLILSILPAVNGLGAES